MSSPTGLTLKTNLNDMEIGDCISCRYTAPISGQSGNFSELGTCIANEIPITGTATPDGLFYFIKTGKGTLIADRIIQHSISWDTLNASKFIEGINFSIFNNILTHGCQNNLVTKVSDTELVFYSNSTAHNGVGIQPLSSPFNAKGIVTIEYDYYPTNFYSSAINAYFALLHQSQLRSFETRYGSPSSSIAMVSFNYTSLTQNTWHAMKAIIDFDANTLKFYYDGTLYNTSSLTGITANEALFFDIGAGYYGGTNNDRIRNIKITTNDVVTNFTFVGLIEYIRSLSGGVAYVNINGDVSLTNTNLGNFPIINEYDKYINNSNLNNKISKGDNSIWNHRNLLYSWCEEVGLTGNYVSSTGTTISSNNGYRCSRGYDATKSMWNDCFIVPSSSINTTTGFRPVLNYTESDIVNEVIY